MLALRRNKGAELIDARIERLVDVALVVGEAGRALDLPHRICVPGDVGAISLEHERLVAAGLNLPNDRLYVVIADGAVVVDAAGIEAHRACQRDKPIEAVESVESVHYAGRKLVLRPPARDEALDAVCTKGDERALGRLREPVRLEAQQRAVDVKECSLDHVSPSVGILPRLPFGTQDSRRCEGGRVRRILAADATPAN